MKKFLGTVKAALLLGALLVIGWSITADRAGADVQAQVFCESVGHDCHVVIGSTTYHLKKQPETF